MEPFVGSARFHLKRKLWVSEYHAVLELPFDPAYGGMEALRELAQKTIVVWVDENLPSHEDALALPKSDGPYIVEIELEKGIIPSKQTDITKGITVEVDFTVRVHVSDEDEDPESDPSQN